MPTLRKKQVVSILLSIACILGVLFAARLVILSRHFGPPPQNIQLTDPMLVRGWMSVQYISNAYHIPLSVFVESLQLKPGQEHVPLRALEREFGTTAATPLVQKVQDIIIQKQADTQPPVDQLKDRQ